MADRRAERAGAPWQTVAICAGLGVLIWFAFGETRNYPFVNFDDPEYIYEVPQINHGLTANGLKWAFTNLPSPNWYPLTNTSHMIEAQLFGMNAGGYHLANVLLHFVATILLFFLLRQMTGAVWRSAFVAAVFAVHPLRVESVAWVAELRDMLSGCFFLVTVAAYVRYARKPSIGRYLVMSILFVCGIMSKPMVVTLPLILLLLDYWPLKRRMMDEGRWMKLVVEKIPLFVLSAVLALITAAGAAQFRSPTQDLTIVSRLTNSLVSYVVYLWQMIWPVNLAVFYPLKAASSFVVAGAFVSMVCITAAAFLLRKTRPYLIVGWLWYVLMLLPVIGLVQINLQAHADRYTYLPQIGLYLAIAWLLRDVSLGWRARKPMLISGAVAVILSLAWVARVQARTWKDSETLWRHAIAVTNGNYFAHSSLADLLLRRGNIGEAIEHCRTALELHPADADAENNLGLALLQKGETREAALHLKRCLEVNPDHMNGQANLAWILATSPDETIRNGELAVTLTEGLIRRSGHPNAIVLRTLAAAYAEAGRFSDAIEAARKAQEFAQTAGDNGLAGDLQRNIEMYQANRPLRMSR